MGAPLYEDMHPQLGALSALGIPAPKSRPNVDVWPVSASWRVEPEAKCAHGTGQLGQSRLLQWLGQALHLYIDTWHTQKPLADTRKKLPSDVYTEPLRSRMPQNMCVPDTALTYILFQRTGYLLFTNHAFFRAALKMLPFVSYERMIALEARLNRERIKAHYAQDMDQEYQSMKAYLPAACSRVLDIGCGVAGIDVLLRQHYQNQAQELQFFLLDKSQLEKRVFYGFKSHGAFYNSLPVAKNVLLVNGIADDHVITLEASDDNTIAIQDRIDLVISLISWGFHYPVETYVQAVYQLLSEQGRLILDVRKKTDGLTLLKDWFSVCDVIAEEKKYVHALCCK